MKVFFNRANLDFARTTSDISKKNECGREEKEKIILIQKNIISERSSKHGIIISSFEAHKTSLERNLHQIFGKRYVTFE